MLKQDLQKVYNMTEGHTILRIISCYRMPGLHAVVIFRFGQWLLKQNILTKIILTPFYVLFNHRMNAKWGISIRRKAEIDQGFYIGHYGGIFIAGNTKIGKNVNISQDVTIGIAGKGDKRGCPVIGDNVYIGAGAKIFGKIKVGNNVKIGANVVVYKDIPDNSIVVMDCMKVIVKTT